MRLIRLIAAVLSLAAAQTAGAQRAAPLGVSAHASSAAKLSTSAAALPGNSGMPSWVRWGLVGALGGALLFTAANGLNNSAHSTGSSILAGAATGFVVVGGGVLLYNSICSSDSGSRSSGFCR